MNKESFRTEVLRALVYLFVLLLCSYYVLDFMVTYFNASNDAIRSVIESKMKGEF